MKLFKQLVLILVFFLKTGNLLSDNNLFNVDNIILEKKENISNKQLTDQAIREAFIEFTNRVLLKEDRSKVSNMNLSDIKELVLYYNLSKNVDSEISKVKFTVAFDKKKIHDLFYKAGILYSDISDKEFYILPILIDGNELFIFSNNYFYENWNKDHNKQLIEFILPLENIEIIQQINKSRESLFNLELRTLFEEYSNKNIAFVLIENNDTNIQKIYLKSQIQDKIISKNLTFKKDNLNTKILNKKIIFKIKDEITNLVKSKNLIDIRVPSFLNVNLKLNKKNNLATINSKIKKIDLIENIFIQEFSNDYVKMKIKYLGKLEKVISQFKAENIHLNLIGEQWFIKAL